MALISVKSSIDLGSTSSPTSVPISSSKLATLVKSKPIKRAVDLGPSFYIASFSLYSFC